MTDDPMRASLELFQNIKSMMETQHIKLLAVETVLRKAIEHSPGMREKLVMEIQKTGDMLEAFPVTDDQIARIKAEMANIVLNLPSVKMTDGPARAG